MIHQTVPSLTSVAMWRRWPRSAVLPTVLIALVLLGNCIGMVKRAARSDSDVGVFYRSGIALNQGAGDQFYAERDTGGFRCIPPVGLAIFQLLARLPPQIAGLVWLLCNLALLGAAIHCLGLFISRLDRHRLVYQRLFPWAVLAFVMLSIGSIQVGQFSLLFTACWIFYLYLAISNKNFWAGMALALPAVIKIYPALMWVVPLAQGRVKASRQVVAIAIAAGIYCVLIPFMFNGSRAYPLTASFVRQVVLNPAGRLSENAHLESTGDQGLEAVLMRYLARDRGSHGQFQEIPHLALPPKLVLRLANLLRLAMLLVFLCLILRRRRNWNPHSAYNLLSVAALTSSTMYLTMPGPKSRYAVYAFLGFLPLLESAVAATKRNNNSVWLHVTAILLALALILQLMPESIRATGIGLVAAGAVWLANIRCFSRRVR